MKGSFFQIILVLFIVIPLVELYILLKVGTVLGITETIAVIIITGLLGAYLAKKEGLGVLAVIRHKLSIGEMPGNEIMEGILILISGALLITPGFLTDIAGFSSLIPFARKKYVQMLKSIFSRRIM